MIDGEVKRLRRLRSAALCIRALARAFGAVGSAGDAALFARAACACWRIARKASGRLNEHPHLSYQKGASPIAAIWDNAVARSLAALMRDRVHLLSSFTRNLGMLSRELDDARALTWSTDLNDILARSQVEIKTLIGVFQDATLWESAPAIVRPVLGAGAAPQNYSTDVVEDWPFLTI
jgi:hypothetical protein